METQSIGTIVVAAGSSSRMEGVDKTFVPLLGQPLIAHTLDCFEQFPPITEIVLVLAAHSVELGRTLVRDRQYRKSLRGLRRRRPSPRLGARRAGGPGTLRLGNGPRRRPPRPERGLAATGPDAVTASEYGSETEAAIAGVPVKDTIKVVSEEGDVTATPPRETLWAAQTPQIFSYDLLQQAHAQFTGDATDDAMMVESLGHKVRMFLGSYENLKVTTPEDLVVVEAVLRGRNLAK